MFRKLGFNEHQVWNRTRLLILAILTFAALC